MGRPALAAVKGLKPRAPTAPRALVTPAASEARPVSADAVSREVSIAPSQPPVAAPIPRASAVECKTVREILPPWEVLQEKLNKKNASIAPARNEVLNQDAQQALAAQEAANSLWSPPAAKTSSPSYAQSHDSIEPPPSSGVRMSDSGPAASDVSAVGMPDSLSFKVYTVADLERRGDSHAPVSMRASRVNFDMTSSRASLHWQRAYVALKEFAAASLAWLKIKGERPSAKVALRKPFDNLGDELQVAVESVDWRKIGVTTGIVVGATLTLLFAVLTAAELTDDLKPPGSAAHLASAETTGIPAKTAPDARGVAPATNMAAMGVQPVEAAPPAPAAEPTTVIIGDIDTPDAPAAAPAKKAAKKPKATKKLALRNAPF